MLPNMLVRQVSHAISQIRDCLDLLAHEHPQYGMNTPRTHSPDHASAQTLAEVDPDTLRQIVLLAQNELKRRSLAQATLRPPKVTRLFQVPESVKYLTPAQIDTWAKAFHTWVQSAKDQRTRQSRTRMWLLFQLLRHTGMRLGEALELDDRSDFDLTKHVVHIGQDAPREIPLPVELADLLRLFFESPMSVELRGQIFQLDPGYVRRIFSERGKDTGIPRDLLNPRVLRHSRAVELLRAGVPMPLVDTILGQAPQPQSAHYVSFSDADSRRIMNHYIQTTSKVKTSARNIFIGQISALRHGTILTEVELTTRAGLKIVSVITRDSFENLGLTEGMTIVATVKAPWVVLIKDGEHMKTSARNKFCGTISAINKGKIAVDVIVDLPDGTKITSLITDESAKSLTLQVGDSICALVKAFAVILTVE